MQSLLLLARGAGGGWVYINRAGVHILGLLLAGYKLIAGSSLARLPVWG